MSSEPTVEGALDELKRIFGGLQVAVDVSYPERSKQKYYYIQVGVNGQDFRGPKLSQVLNQVRAWHRENKGSS